MFACIILASLSFAIFSRSALIASKLPEGIAQWSMPTGGYFVSFTAKPGKASKIYKLCFEAGLKLTPVGATFPYGKDPDNQNLRLSPTQVKNSDLKKSMEIFTLAVLLSE